MRRNLAFALLIVLTLAACGNKPAQLQLPEEPAETTQ